MLVIERAINIKNIFSKQAVKAFLFYLLVIGFAVCHTLFMRMKLPAYGGGIGTYLDDISYAMIVAFILVLIFNLPSLLRKTCLLIFVFIIQFLVFAEWWNYEFYRDYIRYASLGYASDFQEIVRGLEGFQNRHLAIIGLFIFLTLSFILERKSDLIRGLVKTRLVTLGIAFIFALIPTAVYTDFYKLSQIENWYRTTSIPLNYKNPVMQLLREKYIDGVQVADITPLHIRKVNQLYDNQQTTYPFFQQTIENKEPNLKNIIFIVLESVRKYETIPKNNIDLTPNFNQIAANNFTPKFYYANSNQTIKAEIALLCGLHDFLIGTSISAGNNQEIKTNCLPEILKQYGYRSYWFHGAESDFFNRDQFLPKIGFDELHNQATIQHRLFKQGESYVLRSWGVEDPYTFEYAINYLQDMKQPFLAEILSVSNHHPFVDLEVNSDEPYYHPQLPVDSDNIYNRYQHLVHYTDSALGKFWQVFKNSSLYHNTIVVISGDHGIWLFPDDADYNHEAEAAYKYESYLRLPLTIYFPDRSFSNSIDIELSQVDVPKIIANYMGLEQSTAFQSKLDDKQIKRLLDKGKVSDEFINPVFSSIGDNFYYRNSNILCYPPIQTENECDDYLRRCIEQHNVLQTDKTCISLEKDILTTAQTEVAIQADYDIQTPNIVVDYFRKSIYFGAMPEAAILAPK